MLGDGESDKGTAELLVSAGQGGGNREVLSRWGEVLYGQRGEGWGSRGRGCEDSLRDGGEQEDSLCRRWRGKKVPFFVLLMINVQLSMQ